MTYSGGVEEVHALPPAGTPLWKTYISGVRQSANELQITSLNNVSTYG